MAHYDCSNCGASMGIAYGCCGECTPAEVLAAKEALDMAGRAANLAWLERTDTEKKLFIEEFVSEIEQRYNRLYELHNPDKRAAR